MSAASPSNLPNPAPPAWLAVGEVALIVLLFWLQAGAPPPDVNEAHYLAKAKHYWNPDWCRGDTFLESADAHWLFYVTLGQLTRWFDLPTAAWIGRFGIWVFAAWSWRRMCRAIAPDLPAWLAAGLALLLWHRGHMAGEWVIGGVEAKSVAYAFAFLSLAEAARNRTPQALAWAGIAAAFHVLVGGWLLVALGMAWLVSAFTGPRDGCRLQVFVPAGALAVLLATPGWLPAILLTRGVAPEVVTEANHIYVYERLSHHLVFHRFDHGFMLRHAALVIGWFLLWRFAPPSAPLRRIYLVTAGAMVIAVAGIVVDQALLYQPDVAAKLLRYYFFRLSDALLPLACALGVAEVIARTAAAQPMVGRMLTGSAAAVIAAHLLALGRPWEPLPPAVAQSLPRPRSAPLRLWGPGAEEAATDEQPPAVEEPQADTPPVANAPPPAPPLATPAEHAAWMRDFLAACAWIARETPPDALFITARGQQTFKWHAGRPEVVSWKDMPQDAATLVRWFAVWNELHPWENGAFDLAGFSDERLQELGAKYGAKFVLHDRTRGGREIGLPRVYPADRAVESRFEVFRLE